MSDFFNAAFRVFYDFWKNAAHACPQARRTSFKQFDYFFCFFDCGVQFAFDNRRLCFCVENYVNRLSDNH